MTAAHLILAALGAVALFGVGYGMGASTRESTLRHVRAQRDAARTELLKAADDLTLMEAQRFHAEQRRDRAEASWHALMAGRNKTAELHQHHDGSDA